MFYSWLVLSLPTEKQKTVLMNAINVVSALKTGWKMTKSHFIVSLGLVLAYMVVNMLFSFLPITGVMGVVCQLLLLAVTFIWSLGISRLTIDVVDGEEPRFGVFGEMIPRLGSFSWMMIIMLVLLYVPFLLIVIVGCFISDVSIDMLSMTQPEQIMAVADDLGIYILLGCISLLYFSLRLIFAPYIFVDRKVGAVDALKMSWSATAPIQGKILVFFLLSLFAFLIGCLCFFVGIFVSMITLMYAQAALYRQAFSAGIQEPLIVEDTKVVVG